MDRHARSRFWPVLLLLTAIMLVYPPSARADRIDINDPSVLGPVVLTKDLGGTFGIDDFFIRTEVRLTAGTYSYIYAVQSNSDSPGEFYQRMVSFSVTGHPLEETWGAINNSSSYWTPEDAEHVEGSTYPVDSVRPIYDGFIVVPEPIPERSSEQDRMRFAVIYVQSSLPPSIHGTVVYRGVGGACDLLDNECFDVTSSVHRDGFAVPTPEPGTIGLFGLGLAGLAAKLRASRHRRVDPLR